MASKVINISLPKELLEEIDRLARREKRTRSEFFREAARRYLEIREVASWTRADRRAFTELSASAFNRIWDNPIDAELWDSWEEGHAQKAKTR
jgi:metal-responsive CopG/Arc/MetJ family transcriptional regulator